MTTTLLEKIDLIEEMTEQVEMVFFKAAEYYFDNSPKFGYIRRSTFRIAPYEYDSYFALEDGVSIRMVQSTQAGYDYDGFTLPKEFIEGDSEDWKPYVDQLIAKEITDIEAKIVEDIRTTEAKELAMLQQLKDKYGL